MNEANTVTTAEAVNAGSQKWTVIDARKATELQENPHGGFLQRYWLDLSGENGVNVIGAYVRKKPENEIKTGDEIFGHIVAGDYGPMFKGDPLPGGGYQNGAQSRTAPASRDTGRDDYWNRREERDAVSQRRMGRAHAQEMALRVLDGSGALERLSKIEGDPTLEKLKEALRHWTDHFDQDVLDAGLGGGEQPDETPHQEGASTPAPESSAEASAAQKRAITNALNKAGVAKDYQAAIVHGIAGDPPTKAGASQILDVLFAEGDLTDDEKVELLAQKAEATPPSDVPVATEGLDEPKDDDDSDSIPF